MRSHIERMSELENGRFLDDALKRAGRSAARAVDMTRFREFAEVVRFFRIEAESRLPGASRPKGTDVSRLRPGRDRTPDLSRDPGRGGTAVPGGASRGRGRLPMFASSSTLASRSASRHGPSAGREPRSARTRAGVSQVQCGPVARRADGVARGRPIVSRRPRASRPPRRGAAAPALPASSPTSHGSSVWKPCGSWRRSSRDESCQARDTGHGGNEDLAPISAPIDGGLRASNE